MTNKIRKCPNDKEFYEREYIELGKSLAQIGNELGFGKTTIWTRVNKFKLNTNNIGERNGMWKGDKVGIKQLHGWIKERKKKPKFCEKCKINKPFDLANISGKYLRDIKDYEWLCRSCHMKSDGRINNLKQFKNGKQNK